jgi:UDP-2,3-diacylglucosamine pyrophosphatase LpxH
MTRELPDDTLLVFLSDCHIGGDEGRDIFETPNDLMALFDALDAHAGPVELVLAGDFFDFLRIGDFPEGENRARATMNRAEYGELFSRMHRFAGKIDRRIVYLPGNHDAEMWWNQEIRAELQRRGLVHEFALSYDAVFESSPNQLIYCEHGNQFDPSNSITDYTDPLDTPLGSHIVTELIPRVPRGRGVHLSDVERVFPLVAIPDWLAGKLFYRFVTQYVRWLLLPFVFIYIIYSFIDQAVSGEGRAFGNLVIEIGSDVLLLTLLAAFLVLAQRLAGRSMQRAAVSFNPRRDAESETASSEGRIAAMLDADRPPPLADQTAQQISVFVSGHTHAPSLHEMHDGSSSRVQVNSGCWLRQLHPVRAHLGAPTVFVARFVQTHVRIVRTDEGIRVELWNHWRPSQTNLSLVERMMIVGRRPADAGVDRGPRIIASGLVPPSSRSDDSPG